MTELLSANLLLVALLAPLAGALVAGLTSFRFPGKSTFSWFSRLIATFCVFISFLISLYAFRLTFSGASLDQAVYAWAVTPTFRAEFGLLVDGLSALMMCVVTFISLVVHIYSTGYMKDEPGSSRFFAGMAFFTFAMLKLVMANNFLQFFFGWEAVGLASYLLIGFRFERPEAAAAGLKAFLVNRFSDAIFLAGIALLFSVAGSLNFSDIFLLRHEIAEMTLGGTSWSLLTVACLCLFVGAMGKSAQFPLHFWLPDSMEGPTPVSALIHAATMVTAGIFMVTRLSPLFELSDTALSFMLVTGAITALFMGLVATVQSDIKQIIAWSTISQLGYMTMALGASAYPVALFHLLTHAFFKALLFLAAGAVIIAMNRDQDIYNMGGLGKHMPLVWFCALIATLSLVGMPFFSGFYSKESILSALGSNLALTGAHFAYACALSGIFVTAFYAFRLFFLVFHGKERFGRPDADGLVLSSGGTSRYPDEPVGLLPGEKPLAVPRIMVLSLVALAIPSFLAGWVLMEPVFFSDFLKSSVFVDNLRHPAMQALHAHFSGPVSMAIHGLFRLPTLLAASGVLLAAVFYITHPGVPERLVKAVPALHRLLFDRYYLDVGLSGSGSASQRQLRHMASAFAHVFRQIGEARLPDGLITGAGAVFLVRLSGILQRVQSGHLSHYAFVMIVSLLCFLLYICL